ncbi:SigE family RNA polymerase sigma factor [Frankia sp. CNm7]|uniref:SigE family RNA polymerase sigma factor n=1 Tax=Frankia nepalensis TaxID=1836974 RepID=A0A937UMK3_9ACTN|nr:SigE family RNA polymerase sigma factor [Frankia nepalensis]MBL7498341.1 SigE family RNA polymerase sigma factor [Frankia nepalensis]MBL7514989.1 SigE family RNA polymerase sigma factor [Frankia nepalensis]MBL7518668.1 SigE family RNA polymerase sigma factor [Frankia nepalensis]MBL7628934.1 SigE family RNA polymerase sigma factor [Frankia nepalensis]
MRADDERAFEEFVARSGERLLLSAALLVGGDWAAGEDLLQGAFERTYRHWGKIADGAREGYVRRVLVNAATSRWRRLQVRVPEVPLLVDGAWTVDIAAPVTDPADRMSDRADLLAALAALPPRQRAVVVLRYVEDLPEAEVAAALGCSIGSVRSQASRGLARLRDSDHLRALGHAPPTGRPVSAPPAGTPDIVTNEHDGTGPPSRTATTAASEERKETAP